MFIGTTRPTDAQTPASSQPTAQERTPDAALVVTIHQPSAADPRARGTPIGARAAHLPAGRRPGLVQLQAELAQAQSQLARMEYHQGQAGEWGRHPALRYDELTYFGSALLGSMACTAVAVPFVLGGGPLWTFGLAATGGAAAGAATALGRSLVAQGCRHLHARRQGRPAQRLDFPSRIATLESQIRTAQRQQTVSAVAAHLPEESANLASIVAGYVHG